MAKKNWNDFYSKVINKNKITLEIPSGEEYDMWRLKILPFDQFQGLEGKLSYLASFGLLGPTTHNSIPQRYKINEKEQEMEIFLQSDKILSASDKKGRQASISIGCILKNIEISALFYHLDAVITYIANDEIISKSSDTPYILIAKIKFQPSIHKKTTEALMKTMIERKVVRGEFDESLKLDKKLHKEMQSIVDHNFPGLYLYIADTSEELHTIGKLQEDADRTVFEDPDFTFELGHWLLPNNVKNNPTGIRGKEFGFDDEFALKVHNGLLRKERLLPDQIAGFARGGRHSMETASAVAIIAVDGENITKWVDTGRALEGLSLLIHMRGLYSSIHAGITEVDWVNSVFNSTVLKDNKKRATALLRIGTPKRKEDKTRPHSARPLIHNVLI